MTAPGGKYHLLRSARGANEVRSTGTVPRPAARGLSRSAIRRPSARAALVLALATCAALSDVACEQAAFPRPPVAPVRPAGFEALYAMSPYAHVEPRTPYPAVLLLTGMNDPAVTPWQLAKLAARLESATSSGKAILLRVDYAGGHDVFGATKELLDEASTDIFSFLLWQLGAPGFQPGVQGEGGTP